MTVDELRLELQARKLVPSGTAKTDLQYALLRAVGLLPPVESTQADAASFADVGLGARFRTFSGQSNSETPTTPLFTAEVHPPPTLPPSPES